MKKQELARRLARRSGVSPAEAADELDRMVHRILTRLRKGQPAPLPGLGTFRPGRPWAFDFDPEGGKGGRRDGD
jgi:nucleoid DNA-binding protein